MNTQRWLALGELRIKGLLHYSDFFFSLCHAQFPNRYYTYTWLLYDRIFNGRRNFSPWRNKEMETIRRLQQARRTWMGETRITKAPITKCCRFLSKQFLAPHIQRDKHQQQEKRRIGLHKKPLWNHLQLFQLWRTLQVAIYRTTSLKNEKPPKLVRYKPWCYFTLPTKARKLLVGALVFKSFHSSPHVNTSRNSVHHHNSASTA